MTRAEFANKLAKYWMSLGMLEGESLIEFAIRTNDKTPEDYYAIELAYVATNGFDPEPITAKGALWEMQYGKVNANTPLGLDPKEIVAAMNRLKVSRDAIYNAERAAESAKRSRPFVGSHKLPYDSDWD